MEKPKVFGIGFHKTGTSSLHQALKILGYKAIHGDPRFGPPYGDEGRSILQQMQQGNYDLPTLEQYDAFTDNPYFSIWKVLDQKYPGSKFILTLRDEQEWLKSCVQYYKDRRIRPMRHWMFGEYADPSSSPEAAQVWLDTYRMHNEEILEHFKDRPGDLLVLHIVKGEGWEKLCLFLNVPHPNISFPAANVSSRSQPLPHRKGRMFRRWRGGIKRLVYRALDGVIGRKTFYFVSHPKSGRTWLALTLGKILEKQYGLPHHCLIYPFSYLRLFESAISRIVFWHIGSNQELKRNKFFNPGRTHVFFLVRDPRDVVVSYYHQMTQRKVKFSGTISEFVRSEERGIVKVVAYMNFFIQNKEQFKSFTMIRYEDMKADLPQVLQQICLKMEMPVPAELIQEAVDWARFDHMQAREKEGYYTSRVMQLNARDTGNINTYKVRKGQIGSYKEELDETDISYIDSYITEHLNDAFAAYK